MDFADIYLYLKALHIIFVVTWFAGLFYMVRLFIYHAEARKKEEPARSILQKQFKLMEWRLWYIITWPSAILTLGLGCWLFFGLGLWTQPWMHVKLSMVGGLFLYQLLCHGIFKKFQYDEPTWGSARLRIWNEVATIFLFAIVFVVILRNSITWVWGLVGLVLLSVIMMLGIRIYRRMRKEDS